MKVVLRGHYKNDIVPLLEKYKVDLVEKNPDLVLTFGGDGTFLSADREFPDIPKFPVRDSRAADLCTEHSHEDLIKSLANGKLKLDKLPRLSGRFNDRELLALNDIFLHNYNRVNAIRYKVWVDDKLYLKEVASDAFGVATPHGSTAYYKSITNCIFTIGIGMAFSNSREHVDHVIISDKSVIRVKLLRGPALMMADNSPDFFTLETGDEIFIGKSRTESRIYGLGAFMCSECRKLRHIKL